MLLAAAALMAASLLVMAVPAFADKGGGGHCEPEGDVLFGLQTCAGGSGGPGGGGGGKETTLNIFGFPILSGTTGGGSDFQGTGEGGGGRNCVDVLGNFTGFCETGKLAER